MSRLIKKKSVTSIDVEVHIYIYIYIYIYTNCFFLNANHAVGLFLSGTIFYEN
jgi:hypothetical protein